MKQPLMVSVSGGKTSAFMAKRLKDEYGDRFEMIFVFANTGTEWEETLRFVNRCDREWNLGLVWVEAKVNGKRKGTSYRIVDFATASRNGEPFEAVIKKYGIPNKAYPHCTRELKLAPMNTYLKSIGWNDCQRAVGIRADEPRRLREDAAENNIIYPLAHIFPTDKVTINDWWEEQSFTLGLLEHRGNCKFCWKKSTNKLLRIAQETPDAFDFTWRMEKTYGLAGHNIDGRPRTFFREHRSTNDILAMSKLVTIAPVQDDPDADSGCSESCEVYQ